VSTKSLEADSRLAFLLGLIQYFGPVLWTFQCLDLMYFQKCKMIMTVAFLKLLKKVSLSFFFFSLISY